MDDHHHRPHPLRAPLLCAAFAIIILGSWRLRPEAQQPVNPPAAAAPALAPAAAAAEAVAHDAMQQAVLDTLQRPGGEDATVTADIAALARLHAGAPTVLARYLAASPMWRLCERAGQRFAVRRWLVAGRWRDVGQDGFGHGHVERRAEIEVPHFRLHVVIGLSATPWWPADRSTRELAPGQSAALALAEDRGFTSHCLMKQAALSLEITEHSQHPERQLTKAVLAQLERELALLAEQPKWQTIEVLLDPHGIRRATRPQWAFAPVAGESSYTLQAWCNPRGPGQVYIRERDADAATNRELRMTTREVVGWSDTPTQLFFVGCDFTLTATSRQQSLEVWFAPSHGDDRRLHP
jgi:hypothetical protein